MIPTINLHLIDLIKANARLLHGQNGEYDVVLGFKYEAESSQQVPDLIITSAIIKYQGTDPKIGESFSIKSGNLDPDTKKALRPLLVMVMKKIPEKIGL